MTEKVKRIFVEKKTGFDIQAQILCNNLQEFLGMDNLEKVRIIQRYDIEGITEAEYKKARDTIFASPPVDIVYEDNLEIADDLRFFAVEYLPGQYDQRADSASQALQILTQGEKYPIRCAKIFLFSGDISDKDYEKIKDYCINPLDSREASLAKVDSLQMNINYPKQVKTINNFISMSKEDLVNLLKELGLAMSLADLKFIQKYFQEENRDPSLTEIRVLDTYWSDHCRHTTFLTEITRVDFEDGPYSEAIKNIYQKYLKTREYIYEKRDKTICLMDIATIAMKELKKKGLLADLDQSEEVNACSIKVKVDVDGQEQDWLLMFKNETHNHPTEIEPFGGAATCLGGAIRDPLSGRSYVYQAMRVTGSGDPRTPLAETMEGKLPPRKITTEAAVGYSSYGNQIGLATGQVQEFYHERFLTKRMELGAVIAAAPAKNVVRKKPQAGDIIILLGGKTGRDGCGGATGSSKEHTEESLFTCGAEVQKGNPPTERKIQRLFRKPEISRLIKRCNDFGAGGVSVAIGELADSLDIDLDQVPKKYEGLDGTELAISESQERMAIVIAKEDEDIFMEAAQAENLEATVVAKVTDTNRLRMTWQGNTIVDISRKFLDTNGVQQKSQVLVSSPEADSYLQQVPALIKESLADVKEAWLKNLEQLNVCSQKGLKDMFDSTIGAGTVLLPLGGKYQKTPVDGMVAKLPVLDGKTNSASIMTFGYNPQLAVWSPFHGAVYAVVEAVAKSVALGGDYTKIRLTLQEYFEKLGDDPSRWGKPFSALLGAYLVQSKLGIPAIGGKDSMSGSFKDMDVPPTLVAFAVNMTDATLTVSPELKEAGNKLLWIRLKKDQYQLPDFNDLKEKYTAVYKLVKAGKVKAANTVGIGGVAATLSKMAFGNGLGVDLREELKIEELFLPEHGSLVLELDANTDLATLPAFTLLGTIIDKAEINLGEVNITLKEAQESFEKPLEKIFPTKTSFPQTKPQIDLYKERNIVKPKSSFAKPTVFIPIFPGTNCEYDTEARFKEAGAKVETLIFKNLSPKMVKESVKAMVEKINQSQIVMLSGGFSAGDEPEGSGKFIATIFRNPEIKEAVMEFLNHRDGLMLGICNGFQALIKLGLLPYGQIEKVDANSPTLTFNTIGRHVSTMVNTKVVSNLSPWLAKVELGSEHCLAISHGEGRFVASDEQLKQLAKKGQIATQYVNLDGEASYDICFNPNGSKLAIEGITSPDGRIFGKMGHSERIGSQIAKNIPGDKDQQIFKAGVEYFS